MGSECQHQLNKTENFTFITGGLSGHEGHKKGRSKVGLNVHACGSIVYSNKRIVRLKGVSVFL